MNLVYYTTLMIVILITIVVAFCVAWALVHLLATALAYAYARQGIEWDGIAIFGAMLILLYAARILA